MPDATSTEKVYSALENLMGCNPDVPSPKTDPEAGTLASRLLIHAAQGESNEHANSTAQKQRIGRPFEPGQSGNPNGRPKGSRNKISEKFLDTLAEDFETHGVGVIETVRVERPHDYLKIVAALLPKQMQIEDALERKEPREMTDDELEAIIWKTQKRLEEMGVEQALTEDDLTQARARRIARGERL